MKEIPLSNSPLRAIVDDEDFERLSKWTWRLQGNGSSVYRFTDTSDYKGGISMASEVLGIFDMLIDHKDRNGRNNQKDNLRPCSASQNNANKSKPKGCTSVFKGVSRCSTSGKWKVQSMKDGVPHYIGRFSDEIEAAKAYDELARRLHGEFAMLNFPEVSK